MSIRDFVRRIFGRGSALPSQPVGRQPGGQEIGVPVDENGNSLIPELQGRDPTHNEQFLISGEALTAASSNVQEFWWNWRNEAGQYDPKLFVRFLDDSLYVYYGVSLSVAVGFVETASPGRYVWNFLRDKYRYQRLVKGGRRKPSQVVRAR